LTNTESSKEIIFDNELALAKQKVSATRINNNVELLFNDFFDNTCKGDIICGSTFGLCFGAQSQIFLCDD